MRYRRLPNPRLRLHEDRALIRLPLPDTTDIAALDAAYAPGLGAAELRQWAGAMVHAVPDPAAVGLNRLFDAYSPAMLDDPLRLWARSVASYLPALAAVCEARAVLHAAGSDEDVRDAARGLVAAASD